MLQPALLERTLFHPWLRWLQPIALLISCFYLAWLLLAQCQFFYSANYELLNVGQHIQQYGPQNRYKPHFEMTDKSQHIELFEKVVHGIRYQPETLSQITYTVGHQSYTLLRPPEAQHLRDVAALVQPWERFGQIITAFTLLFIIVAVANRRALPRAKPIGALILGLITLSVLIAVIDPQAVFAWLHTMAFPPEHPWFFYYQDSLMTTWMKAPDLFFAIGIEWLLSAIILLIIYLVLVSKIHNPRLKSLNT